MIWVMRINVPPIGYKMIGVDYMPILRVYPAIGGLSARRLAESRGRYADK